MTAGDYALIVWGFVLLGIILTGVASSGRLSRAAEFRRDLSDFTYWTGFSHNDFCERVRWLNEQPGLQEMAPFWFWKWKPLESYITGEYAEKFSEWRSGIGDLVEQFPHEDVLRMRGDYGQG